MKITRVYFLLKPFMNMHTSYIQWIKYCAILITEYLTLIQLSNMPYTAILKQKS